MSKLNCSFFNTGATQSLYWTITTIPVTVVVLAVAFVYGYKGDEVGDWIYDRIRVWDGTRFARPAERAEARKTLIPTTDGRRVPTTGRVRCQGERGMEDHPSLVPTSEEEDGLGRDEKVDVSNRCTALGEGR